MTIFLTMREHIWDQENPSGALGNMFEMSGNTSGTLRNTGIQGTYLGPLENLCYPRDHFRHPGEHFLDHREHFCGPVEPFLGVGEHF